MAISIKKEGLFSKKWRFADGKTLGNNVYTGKELVDLTRCTSIYFAEFWQNYAIASNLTENVEELIKFVNNAPQPFETKKAVLQTIGGQEQVLKSLVTKQVSNIAVSEDKAQMDHKNLEKVILPELIEFPVALAEDARIQDTAGYQTLQEIVNKSVNAIDSYYRSQIIAEMSVGRPEATIEAMIQTAKDNTELFELELKLATTNLLYKKISSLEKEMKEIGENTAEKIATTKKLAELSTENRKQAELLQKAIDDFNKKHNKQASSYVEDVMTNVETLGEKIVSKQGKLETAKAKNAEATETLEDEQIWAEAVKNVLDGVKVEAAASLYSACVGEAITSEEIAKFLDTGEIPESLKKYVKKIPRSEQKRYYEDFIKEAEKEKAKLIAEAEEAQTQSK